MAAFSTRHAGLAASALSLATLAGCYEHVVDARGFGTDGITIHEANLPAESDGLSPADERAKRRRDLNDLNRSIPTAPRAY